MSNDPSLRIPKYRRHKPTGQAVVTLSGRDLYLGKYGSAPSKQAYQRVTAEWLQAGGNLPTQRDDITVVEVVAAYMRFAQSYYHTTDTNRTTTTPTTPPPVLAYRCFCK